MNIVWVGLPQSGISDLHELSLFNQGWDVRGTNITHPGAQTPVDLEDNVGNVTLVFNPSFDSFRNKLVGFIHATLEVTIRRAVSLGHRTNRTHSSVSLVFFTAIFENLTRSLSRTGKHSTKHHSISTSC